MNRLLCAMLVLWAVTGCGVRPGRKASLQNTWMSSRYSSAEEAWVYLNFYSEYEDFDRYVGYAVINYTRNTERDSSQDESVFLKDALRLCREEFRDVYLNGSLTRWDSQLNTRVPYDPKYVAVVVSDFSGKSEEVGIVVPAAEVFSNVSIEQVVESANVSRGDIWFDDISEEENQRGYSPGMVVRYTNIEDHMRSIKSAPK